MELSCNNLFTSFKTQKYDITFPPAAVSLAGRVEGTIEPVGAVAVISEPAGAAAVISEPAGEAAVISEQAGAAAVISGLDGAAGEADVISEQLEQLLS